MSATDRFDEPVFLAGLAGSGKTQLRLGLDEIPSLSITRRTKLWQRIDGQFGDLTDDDAVDRCFEALAGFGGVTVLEPDLDALRRDVEAGPRTYPRLIDLFHRQVATRRGCTRWGDQAKSLERHGAAILQAYPQGRMIHLVRDVRSQVRGRSGNALRRAAGAGADAARWIASMDAARSNRARFGDRYLVVRYEDLAADPVAVVGHVCGFIDEPVPASLAEVMSAVRFDEVHPDNASVRSVDATDGPPEHGDHRTLDRLCRPTPART